MNEDTFVCALASLKQRVSAFLADEKVNSSNVSRRKLYCEADLLKCDLEELAEGNAAQQLNAWPTDEQFVLCSKELNDILQSLPLVAVRRSMKDSAFFYNPLFMLCETYIRFAGVSCSIFFGGAFVSLPILLLRAIDMALERDPYAFWSDRLKRLVTSAIIYQAGMEVRVEGLHPDLLANGSTFLQAFTHACNMDGFFVSSTCPVRQLAFGKKELFLAPFFSWLSLAAGGIPVDRGHRERAIQALERSVASAKASGRSSKVCIAIAPEGTRSQSGQLLPFKKGAFYMWEQLGSQAPLLPFVILGAYDLYHPKHWVNTTGKVTVRFLPPIAYDAALSKAQTARKVRRVLLRSIADCPADVGEEVSASFKLSSLLANVLMVALTCAVSEACRVGLIDVLGLTHRAAICLVAAMTVLITLALYVYYVYIIYMGSGTAKRE